MQSGLGGWRGLMPTCMLGRKEHKVRFVCLFMHAMGEWWMLTCIRMHMGWRVCVWRDGSGAPVAEGAQRRSTALWPPEPLQGCRGAARQPAGVRGPLAGFWPGSRGKRFLGPVSTAVHVSGGGGTQIEQFGGQPHWRGKGRAPSRWADADGLPSWRERNGFQLLVAEPGKGCGVQARVSDLPWMSFGLSGRLLTPCCW